MTNDPPIAAPPAPTGIEVEISDTQSHLTIDPESLARIARRTLEAQGIGRASISIAVVDDPTIRALNARHLGHDWPTDVICFGLSEPDAPELAGELIVSAEMAATAARSSGVTPLDELALYVVHGLLHLSGLDDTTPDSAAAMRLREGEILAGLGRINPFPLVGPVAGPEGRECVRWPR